MLLTRSSATFFYDIELFQYAGTGDLATLCRVSRMFQHGAEHILYHNVKLQNITDGDRLISWCHAIVGMERRAHRVHTLHLPTRFELSQPLATSASAEAIGKMIKLAFKAMINLRQLCCSTVVSGSARLASLHPSTLEDCEFHLSAFAGELPSFMPSDVWKFLARHPGITYWAPGHPLLCSIPSFPSSILPNLNEVVFTRPALTLCLKGRPIQTLVLVFTDLVHRRWDGLEAIAPLESFNDTLHHLVYLQGGNMCVDWTAVDIVCSISQKVPKLRSLHLDCRVAEIPIEDQQRFVDVLAGFQNLDTLSLHVNMMMLHLPNNESPDPQNPLEHRDDWLGCSPVQCRKVAAMFMTSCRSLRQISFPFLIDPPRYACYVRCASKDNPARLDGFHSVEMTSWMRFQL